MCFARTDALSHSHLIICFIVGDKIRDFLKQLRHLRIFIAIWNVVVLFLMVLYVDALIYHIPMISAWHVFCHRIFGA